MKTIKIGFAHWWGELIPDDNYFYHILKMKYNVIIDNINPDILFYNVYGNTHLQYDMKKIIKIFVGFECVTWNPYRSTYDPAIQGSESIHGGGNSLITNFNHCHYSLAFDYSDDKRSYRLPLWVCLLNWFDRPYRPERDQAYLHNVDDFLNKKIPNKEKFASFIATQPKGKRVNFVPQLYQYKHIDCGGRLYNNINLVQGRGDQKEKIDFIKNYKFNICFENTSHNGYATEKIIHSMFADCIPIYWGDPMISNDFNEDSFLNWHKFNSDEKLIEEIIKIDNDEKLYKEMISQPWFKDNKIPDYVLPESVLTFFEKIID